MILRLAVWYNSNLCQRDGLTHDDRKYRSSIASRGYSVTPSMLKYDNDYYCCCYYHYYSFIHLF